MSWQKWVDDRLFVLDQTVHQALRRLPAEQRLEILRAVATTCEGRPGTAAMTEHLLEWAQDEDEPMNAGVGADRLIRHADEMHRIYGDRSVKE